jgi:hypothetical protein
MVREMRLPLRAIEGTSIVGPFFWAALDADSVSDDAEAYYGPAAWGVGPDDYAGTPSAGAAIPPHRRGRHARPDRADGYGADANLQIIYRKSDVKKRGKTRGWEMMLSHSFRTGITSGYIKGTPNAEIKRALAHMRRCTHQVAHPMLLPVVVLSYDLSSSTDERQRAARDWLRQLENAVTMREEIETNESYFQDDVLDLDSVSRDLVECHSQVLWKRPQAYQALIREMIAALRIIKARTRVPPPPPVPAAVAAVAASGLPGLPGGGVLPSPLLRPVATSGSGASGAGLPLALQAPRSPNLNPGGGSPLLGGRGAADGDDGASFAPASRQSSFRSLRSQRTRVFGGAGGGGGNSGFGGGEFDDLDELAATASGGIDDSSLDVLAARRRQWVEFDKLHRSMLARFDFYRLKLTGTEHYAHTSLERLKIQREAVSLL